MVMEQRTPLLLLHGFPLNPGMWGPQVEYFAEERLCLAPDLRLSGQVAEAGALPEAVTMERMAEEAIAALDEAGFERCVAVGFSMGGYVALALHALYPERLAGLVLADTRSEADTEEGRKGRLGMARDVMERGANAALGMADKLLAPETLAARADLVERVRGMIAEATPEAIASAALGMAQRSDRTGELPAIRVPVLAIAGEHDAITPPEGARKMAEAVADGTFELIAGGGHLANLEQPEAFNKALSAWLRSKQL
jgi:3-oxoadipate enol-lactonase